LQSNLFGEYTIGCVELNEIASVRIHWVELLPLVSKVVQFIASYHLNSTPIDAHMIAICIHAQSEVAEMVN